MSTADLTALLLQQQQQQQHISATDESSEASDLVLAATIGQGLVDQNEQLRIEIFDLKSTLDQQAALLKAKTDDLHDYELKRMNWISEQRRIQAYSQDIESKGESVCK